MSCADAVKHHHARKEKDPLASPTGVTKGPFPFDFPRCLAAYLPLSHQFVNLLLAILFETVEIYLFLRCVPYESIKVLKKMILSRTPFRSREKTVPTATSHHKDQLARFEIQSVGMYVCWKKEVMIVLAI